MHDKPLGTSLAPYVRAAAIGAAAGLRSFSPPAAVFRSNKRRRTALTLIALGEMVADKFPQAPSRLFAPALIWRTFAGGWCGGEIAQRGNGTRATGIVAGSLAAAAEDAMTLLFIRFGLQTA